MTVATRKSLCADTLISDIHRCFQKISDPRKLSGAVSISFVDILMSGLAVFGLKFPSLLKYDQNRHTLDRNLLSLYHIAQPPSDSYMQVLGACIVHPDRSNLCPLMMLAFLVDQIQGMTCVLFQTVKKQSRPLGKVKGSLRICGVAFLGVSIPIHDG
jgi:hypothetical protein